MTSYKKPLAAEPIPPPQAPPPQLQYAISRQRYRRDTLPLPPNGDLQVRLSVKVPAQQRSPQGLPVATAVPSGISTEPFIATRTTSGSYFHPFNVQPSCSSFTH